MEKSIETTWREGFLSPDALVAPRINDLCNRRSTHIVDKIQRMFKINQVAVVVGAPVQWIFLSAVGIPVHGRHRLCVAPGSHWRPEVALRRHGASRQQPEQLPVPQGLSGLVEGADGPVEKDTEAPLLSCLSGSHARPGGLAGRPGSESTPSSRPTPTSISRAGIPVVLLVGVFVVAVVIEFLGGAIFDFDVNTVYRPVFRKLDQMVEDMG